MDERSINDRVMAALGQNVQYAEQEVLGLPASHLDTEVFEHHAAILKDAPYLNTLWQNPNHIGCHTLGASEPFFKGTQALEREVIDICACDILHARPGSVDGYVAAGGTEANIQAVWVYRNRFIREMGATPAEIVLLCAADAHYSMDKAADLLMMDICRIPVHPHTRSVASEDADAALEHLKASGKRYVIAVATMMTTMFGSVDDPDVLTEALERSGLSFCLHVDGAYGGFYFPFTGAVHRLDFQNPHVTSITLDAHKMAQAPYGTGIFLIRKGYIQYANTRTARYVAGEDFTLSGSRSGANAVAIWMILATYGPFSWREKIFILQKRCDWLCQRLQSIGVSFYRHPQSNIVTMPAQRLPLQVAARFGLVPDDHQHPEWYKIVIMEHVTIEKLEHFCADLEDALREPHVS